MAITAQNIHQKPGYKQTEAGVIPEDWEMKKLGEVADVKTGPFGSALHEKDYVYDGTPIITVEHLGEQGVVYENLPMVSDVDRKRLKAYSLLKGDIVFSRVGSVDRNALIKEEESGWLFSGRLLRIRLKTVDIYSSFLSYYFNQESAKQRIRAVAVGQTMASLNTQILRNIDIALPPIKPEQIAIATVLSDIDALITSLDKLITKKRDIKQATMQQLLTGKTRLPGFCKELKPTYKQTEIGELPEDWSVKRLEELGYWKGGATPPMANASFWINGTIYWASSGDVKRRILSKTANMITEIAVKQSSTTLLQEGAILIVTRSGILRKYLPAAKNTVPIAINQDIKALIPNSQISADYLLQILSERGPDILSTCMKSGTTVESVEYTWLKKYQISLPPPPEQQAIATVLSDMDAEISALEQRRDKTRALKQAMMQELLTGKTRLL